MFRPKHVHERCVNTKGLLLKVSSRWRQFSRQKTRRGRNKMTSSECEKQTGSKSDICLLCSCEDGHISCVTSTFVKSGLILFFSNATLQNMLTETRLPFTRSRHLEDIFALYGVGMKSEAEVSVGLGTQQSRLKLASGNI